MHCANHINQIFRSRKIFISFIEPINSSFPFAPNSNLPYLLNGQTSLSLLSIMQYQVRIDGHFRLVNLNDYVALDTSYAFRNYLRTLSLINYKNIVLIQNAIMKHLYLPQGALK